ncbi:MAG TPA: glycosyltransferase [bacterium]|nr:glycosyltransferase [bacterium]HQG44481.1 glycosyltransferase [bacterium]HQI47421.1 glycosyltransferase [bacterium]HQJ63835.1 glycosyltransferase [bacterium]
MKRITVLFIIDVLFGEGGTEVHLFNLVTGLDPKRFRPIIVPLFPEESPMIDRMRAEGLLVFPLPVHRLHSFATLGKLRQLVALIKTHKVDIVQTYHFMSDVLGSLAAKLAGVPWALSSRRDKGFNERGVHRLVRRLITPLVDLDICVSEDLRRQLLAVEKRGEARVITLYNGTTAAPRLSAAARQAKLAELGLDGTRPVVGSVMNFRPIKGAQYLVEAAVQVLRQFPEVQFVIVGGLAVRLEAVSAYQNKIIEIIKRHHMNGSLKFVGNREDAREIMELFDVFVLPSLSEGFSNALIEAMRAGKGIIATAVGGNPEAIDHGVNGVLVPPGDENAIARSLLELLAHPGTAKHLGECARAKAERCFTVERMVRDFASLYERLYQGDLSTQ